MDKKHIDELIRNIRDSIKCPNCGASYRASSIFILGEVKDTVLVQLECGFCKVPALASVTIKQQEANENNFEKPYFETSGMSSFRESQNADLEKVTTDDVLDMHKFLKNFDGDFKKILE